MDVNLRKTATDTAYIVVGVGVLGFQQAQVRRRDTVAKLESLRRDATGTLRERTDRIKARSGSCASRLGDQGRNLRTTVGETVGTRVSNAAESVGTQVRAGADAARAVDPRALVDPIVGDLRVRVEPVVEQLRTISLPDSVSSLPDQVSKALEAGRSQVQGRLGSLTPPPLKAAATA
jgi:hypothetical protein